MQQVQLLKNKNICLVKDKAISQSLDINRVEINLNIDGKQPNAISSFEHQHQHPDMTPRKTDLSSQLDFSPDIKHVGHSRFNLKISKNPEEKQNIDDDQFCKKNNNEKVQEDLHVQRHDVVVAPTTNQLVVVSQQTRKQQVKPRRGNKVQTTSNGIPYPLTCSNQKNPIQKINFFSDRAHQNSKFSASSLNQNNFQNNITTPKKQQQHNSDNPTQATSQSNQLKQNTTSNTNPSSSSSIMQQQCLYSYTLKKQQSDQKPKLVFSEPSQLQKDSSTHKQSSQNNSIETSVTKTNTQINPKKPKTSSCLNLGNCEQGQEIYDMPEFNQPFREQHLIECLSVQAADPKHQVLFYTMLNQGKKRGKETDILALDCERIQTKKGDRLARISIVNFYGNVVFDTLVKPWAKVTDYREKITGIKSEDLKHAPSYPKIAPILKKILDHKIVIGHSLTEDFKHLKLNESEYSCDLRDVAELPRFQRFDQALNQYQKKKLQHLAVEYLNAGIQTGHHSSITDARAALALYRTFQLEIEEDYRNKKIWHFDSSIQDTRPLDITTNQNFLMFGKSFPQKQQSLKMQALDLLPSSPYYSSKACLADQMELLKQVKKDQKITTAPAASVEKHEPYQHIAMQKIKDQEKNCNQIDAIALLKRFTKYNNESASYTMQDQLSSFDQQSQSYGNLINAWK